MLGKLLQHLLPDRLHKAAQEGDVRRMRAIVNGGFDVNLPDKQGATPIFYTAGTGTIEGARLLLDHGADLNHRAASGGMPLHSALLQQQTDLALFLMDNGADIRAATDPGATPLHIAALGGLNLVVSRLLREGVDINAVTERGQSPLLFALLGLHSEKTDDPACVRVLLAAGADPRAGESLAKNAVNFRDEVKDLFRAELEKLADSAADADLCRFARDLAGKLTGQPDTETERETP